MSKSRDSYKRNLQFVQERAHERYGMALTPSAYDELTIQVWSMGPERAISWDGTQGTFIVDFRGRRLVAVFDMETDLVASLLLPEDFAHYLHV